MVSRKIYFRLILTSTMAFGGFLSGAEDLPKCSTNWNRPHSSESYLAGTRPGFDYTVESKQYPIAIHATSATPNEYTLRILSYAETSWSVIVGQMGFRAPLPDQGEEGDDRVDIYIRGDLTPGVGGYTGFSGFNDATPVMDAYGYLVIADKLNDIYIKGVVAHEFFHLTQMSYDWFEHPSFMEATAVWVTDHVFDDENFYSRYYRYFNQSPTQSLDRISLADPYQYGAGMWFQYLDERFGDGNGAMVKALWESTVQNEMDNEPDYFDVMESYLGGASGLAGAYRDFGLWRLKVGSRADGHHLREAETWAENVIPSFIEIKNANSGELISWTVPTGMQPFSQAFLKLDNLSDHSTLDVQIDQQNEIKDVNFEIFKTSATERIVILTRSFQGSYDPETSAEDAIPVSGKLVINP